MTDRPTRSTAWTLAWAVIVLQFAALALLLWMHQSDMAITPDAYPNEAPQDTFLGAYLTVQVADRAKDRGDWFNAARLYAAADARLRDLRREHPDWEPALIEYRRRYIERQRGRLAAPMINPLTSPLYAAWTLVALAALLACLLALLRLRRRPL